MSDMSILYNAVNDFCLKRRDARRAYLQTLKQIDDLKGSRRYDEEKERARVARASAVSVAKIKAQSTVDRVLARMMERAGAIELEPPTEKQMAVLNYLEKRKTLTQNEVEAAANTLKDSGLALELLRQLAQDRGVNFPLISLKNVKRSLTLDEAKSAVSELARTCGSIFADDDGANDIRKLTARWHSIRYGGGVAVDPAVFDQGDSKVFESESDFYSQVLGVDADAFSRAVDG